MAEQLNMCQNSEESGITHNCGVFGCIASTPWPSHIDVAHTISLGLISLQHRGQESAGIVTSKGDDPKERFNVHKGMGLVTHVMDDRALSKLKGNMGIGHTRYSTSASSEIENCQPFIVYSQHGPLAVAHNGQLVNADALRKKVLDRGIGLSTTSDSELITQALCLNPPEGEPQGKPNWVARIKNVMGLAPLSYSLVIMHGDRIFGVRDPFGNRPLCIGKLLSSTDASHNLNSEEGWIISSESSGFQTMGARYVREVEPGEIIELTRDGFKSLAIVPKTDPLKLPAFCIFEYVYFSKPDSVFEGQMVYSVRLECGKELAKEAPCLQADIVSSVPESGTAAAFGYAKESGIPYFEVLCKNRYVGRTFIQPNTKLRQLGVAKKFGAIIDNVLGKRIILIDDSIVRGNTIRPIISLLRDAGAKEIHIRVASPPIKYPCYMGINIPTREELIANKLEPIDLAEFIGADSLEYLSIKGLTKAVKHNIKEKDPKKVGHCIACLSGTYPEKLEW